MIKDSKSYVIQSIGYNYLISSFDSNVVFPETLCASLMKRELCT